MKRKLALHRETVRNLAIPSLRGARGGSIFEPTGLTYCLQCGSGETVNYTCGELSRLQPCTIDWTNCECLME